MRRWITHPDQEVIYGSLWDGPAGRGGALGGLFCGAGSELRRIPWPPRILRLVSQSKAPGLQPGASCCWVPGYPRQGLAGWRGEGSGGRKHFFADFHRVTQGCVVPMKRLNAA